jgi:hypothetical protein
MDDPYREGPAPVLLDAEAQARLKRELGAGETLLWVGRPRGGLLFEASDWFMVPFSLAIAVLIVVREAEALWKGALFTVLFGMPFVAVFTYAAVGRFLYDAWKRKRTVYGVTNARALIAEQGQATRSLELSADVTTVEEHADGTGTITFGQPPARRSQPKPPKFIHVPHAHDVHQLLRDRANAHLHVTAVRVVTDDFDTRNTAIEIAPAEWKNDA